MKRPFRLLFNTAAALSLFLCISTAAIWARSYWVRDLLIRTSETQLTRDSTTGQPARYRRESRHWEVDRGLVSLTWQDMSMNDPSASILYQEPVVAEPRVNWKWIAGAAVRPRDPAVGFWHRLGFQRVAHVYPPFDHMEPRTTFGYATWPLWAVLAGSAALPGAWAARRIARRRRELRGHCTACGYDLRATPERCPECGTVPSRANSEIKSPPNPQPASSV